MRREVKDRGEVARSGKADLAGIVSFCLFLVWLVARSIHSPHWSWDLVPYVACVLESRFSEPVDLHAATFEEIRRVVPPGRYASLTTGTDYWTAVFRDPEALHQQLPFYRVKSIYVALLRVLASLGLSPVTATLAVSIAASVSFAVLVFFWLRLHFAASAAGPFTALLSLLIGLPIIARISTPDALSGLCLLVALFALCEHAALGAASVLIVLSVAIRSDNVIAALGFAALLFGIDRRGGRLHPWAHATTALGGVLVYVVSVHAAEAYPWTTFFAHSFGAPISRPAEWHGGLSLPFYLAVLARNSHMFLDPQPATMVLLAMVAFAQLSAVDELGSCLRRSIPPTVLLFAVIRYLLYPYVLGRHLYPFYATIGVLFLTSNAELLRRFGGAPEEPTRGAESGPRPG
jgi:hypothetical protein